MAGKIKLIDLKGLRLVLEDKRSFWIRPTHSLVVATWAKSQTISLQENKEDLLYPILLVNEEAKISVQAQVAQI